MHASIRLSNELASMIQLIAESFESLQTVVAIDQQFKMALHTLFRDKGPECVGWKFDTTAIIRYH